MSVAEFEIISRYFATAELSWPRPEIVLGIGDDAALLHIGEGQELALTLDVLVADVHFPAAMSPEFIAQRSLAVNLSDLAAMGARPLCFTLGLTMPSSEEQWLAGFAAGLAQLAREYDCPLVGGDVTRGPLSVAIQAHGLGKPGSFLRRDGARVGDRVLVTGTLGDAALGLVCLQPDAGVETGIHLSASLSAADRTALLKAYQSPQPRVGFGLAMVGLAHSAIDLSDGLAGDLGHIVAASGVGARLRCADLPLSEAALAAAAPADCQLAALFGGDDYELCLTADPGQIEQMQSLAAQHGLRLTEVGEIIAGEGVALLDESGAAISSERSAYRHF